MLNRSRLVILLCLCLLTLIAAPFFTHSALLQSSCPESRLEIGGQGQVTPGSANRVRSIPSTSGELLGEIPSGARFNVLEGPECADGFLWVRVDYNGLVGWTAEGNSGGYFVDPVTSGGATATPAAATPAPSDDCAMETRLAIGREAKPTTNTPSRLRDNPGTSGTQIGQIDPLDIVQILEGPVCANGINWWRVDASGVVGWTAEGVDGEYLLEMLALVPTATPPYIGIPHPLAITWSADGATIAVGTLDNGVFLFDATDFDAPPTQILEDYTVPSLVFHPEQPNLMALNMNIDDNLTLNLIDAETGEVLLPIVGDRPIGIINSATFSADGTQLGFNNGGTPTVIDPETGEQLFGIVLKDWSNGQVAYMGASRLTLSPDGTLIGVYDGRVRLVPVGDASETAIDLDRDVIDEVVLTLAFNPENNNLIVGDIAGNLQMWNAETLQRTSFIRGQRSNSSNRVNELVFDADGTVVVTAESDPNAVVRVFNAVSLQQVDVLDFGPSTDMARGLVFSPDGSQLAVLVDDTVRILETTDYTQIGELVLQRN